MERNCCTVRLKFEFIEQNRHRTDIEPTSNRHRTDIELTVTEEAEAPTKKTCAGPHRSNTYSNWGLVTHWAPPMTSEPGNF